MNRLVISTLALAAACASPPATPKTTPASVEAIEPAPAATRTRRPRGADAYSGQTQEDDGGQAAPTGTLIRDDGTPVKLTEIYQRGPAVLVFYRGHW